MKTEKEIIDIAASKIKAAACLIQNAFFAEVYPIGSYDFEPFLKTKIYKTLLIPDSFDFDSKKK